MAAAVFILKSDKEFISSSLNGKDILVYENKAGDMNDIQIMRPTFTDSTRVGPTSEQHKSLQVFGVTIEGDRLGELVRELRAIEEGTNIYFFVNRLGLCIITQIKHPSIKAMRINDCFGWSKYGVRVPHGMIDGAVWNKLDMFNGETMMDVAGSVKAAEEAKLMRRVVEEQSVELTVCRKELEWSRKNEELWGKLVQEKMEKVKMLENQLVAFKAALRQVHG